MFQALRPNNQIFILHKDKPLLETGTVLSVSIPSPKYNVPPSFGMPQEMVVDIVVRVNNQDVTYQKLPASAEVADFGNNTLVITDNRDAMNSEIACLKQKSMDIVNSKEFHENLIVEYDKLLVSLNPEFAEKKAQQSRIDALEAQVTKLVELNSQLMARLSAETPKTTENNESMGA